MSANRSRTHVALWVVQGLLAALFLFAGGFKLVTPPAELARLAHMSAPFLEFIGACEVLGALGLLLPGIFRVRQGLTSLAAAGLALIMVGAVVLTLAQQGLVAALFPFATGVLAACVAVGRRPAGAPRAASDATPVPFAR